MIVDSRGRVLSCFADCPGSVHDARVFRLSGFNKRLLAGEVLNGPSIVLGGADVPQYLVGDAGYPLMPVLVVPYPGTNLAREKKDFNHKQSCTRMPVECFFGSRSSATKSSRVA